MEWQQVLQNESDESRIVVGAGGCRGSLLRSLEELRKTAPELVVIDTSWKRRGAVILSLYRYAIRHHADLILQTVPGIRAAETPR